MTKLTLAIISIIVLVISFVAGVTLLITGFCVDNETISQVGGLLSMLGMGGVIGASSVILLATAH